MRTLGIAGKIWLSIGVFAAGTVMSLTVSQVESLRAERRLRVVRSTLFPAAQSGQKAEEAFEKMVKEFQQAVMLEEPQALEEAKQQGLHAAAALTAAAGVGGMDPERARSLTALAADVSAFVSRAASAYRPMLAAGDNLTTEMEAGSRDVAERTTALKRSVSEAREQLAADLRAELEHAVRASTRLRWVSLFVFLGALAACGVVVTVTIQRAVVGPIRLAIGELTDAASQVASSSGELASSSQSLSRGATQQAASLEQTSASIEGMAAMTRKNARNSQQAAVLMGEVDARAKASNQSLDEMVAAMGSIQDSSRQVAKIIKAIDEIAFQTNILALNAAVEAARAGEAGMGFAVVADEVRSLAQRSAQAARETATLIEASIGKAQDGNRKVSQLASSITGIITGIEAVKDLVDEVSEASVQQTQGIDQVSQAIRQMERVTQTTAATAEQSAAASQELSAQAESSMVVVRRLDAIIGSGTGAREHDARRAAAAKLVRPLARAAGLR